MDFLSDLWNFMKERKKWWLTPVIIVLLLIGYDDSAPKDEKGFIDSFKNAFTFSGAEEALGLNNTARFPYANLFY